ncbi:Uncharacterized protein HZ326_3531 [Fusarium oxysporum f. sp. albedinis]|nr:Uncharacterized protein HZ326_3531 [Fusarium oxysporum f. sp. albedinis]
MYRQGCWLCCALLYHHLLTHFIGGRLRLSYCHHSLVKLMAAGFALIAMVISLSRTNSLGMSETAATA